ncbi:MAG: FAD/NAD(P)-binding protein [Candidatus Berkelbacteria bacterium]|nr:FAD/NAD(P)-binding protein [Candidatus Berkelbacteria bacterium]
MPNQDSKFKYTSYEIIKKEEMMPGMFLFRLKGRLDFKPGQFVQAALEHFGEGTFAPCSDPNQKDYFELCIRGCGSTSNGLITLLPGDEMLVRGPYGNGWPIKKLWYKDTLLIAGGMGLVPLRPLIFEMLRSKINFDKITLVAGFKTDEHLLFSHDLEIWRKKLSKVIPVVEIGSKNFWGEIGMITEPLKNLVFNKKKTIALICGPEVMVPFVNQVLEEKGLPHNQIYISYERRMECGIGICQHCNIGSHLVCKDGPIFRYDQIKEEVGK